MNNVIEKDGWVNLTGPGFEISFKKGSKSVSYDAEKGGLVLTDLPDELVAEIEEQIRLRSS